MARKCSHCGNTGHNSRTCASYRSNTTTALHNCMGGLRIFGVHLALSSSGSIKEGLSVDCLRPSSSSSTPSHNSSSLTSSRLSLQENLDGLLGRNQERKKGVPWTEEEHRTFLQGLENLGKGDWRGISKNFVKTRTPTQVASHAQKYFIRQDHHNNNNNTTTTTTKKRRSSVFDMVSAQIHTKRTTHDHDLMINHQSVHPTSSSSSLKKLSIPNLDLTLAVPMATGQTNPSSSPLLIRPISVMLALREGQ